MKIELMIDEVKVYDRLTQVRARTLGVNAYIIEYPEHLTVIDSLMLPSDSKELSEIAAQRKKPVKYLINTHFHSDHSRGNRFIRSENTIQINHKEYWQTIIRERSMINPKRYKPVDRKLLTNADLTINSDYNGPDDLLLLTTPGHSPDSITIYMPDENVIITGDTVLSNTSNTYSLPYFYWGNIDDLIRSLHKLIKVKPQTIYSGHGFPLEGISKIQSDLEYLKNLRNTFNALAKTGDIDDKELPQIELEGCLQTEKKIAVLPVHKYNIQRLWENYLDSAGAR